MRTLTTMLMLLCSGAALAAPASIAVLEFRNPAELTDQEVVYITELARGEAARLPAAKFSVMTRENILELLPPGTRIEECVGECEVETGRNVGADYIMTGEVLRVGGSLKVLMKLHDTKTARMLGNERASAPRVDALEEPVEQAAGRLFSRLWRRGPRAPATEGPGAFGQQRNAWDPGGGGQVLVHFASEPKGAVVLVDGEIVFCDAGGDCASNLTPGLHEVEMQLQHYLSRTEQVDARAGLEVRWRLTPNFALLTVESVPRGLEVTVDGKSVGKTPLRDHRVALGQRAVLVKSPCHYDEGERIRMERGEHRRLAFTLDAREAAIDVTATTAKGRPVAGEVSVDGREVGRSPGQFKVPVCSKRIEVRTAEGEWADELDLREHQARRIHARLDPRPGRLFVTATEPDGRPCRGEVLVDGLIVGSAPWNGDLSQALHDIEVVCDAGHARASVDVFAGQRKDLELRVPARTPRRSWRPPRLSTYEPSAEPSPARAKRSNGAASKWLWGGTAALVLGGAIAFAASSTAGGAADDAESVQDVDAAVDTAETGQTVGLVLLGTALASAVVAILVQAADN